MQAPDGGARRTARPVLALAVASLSSIVVGCAGGGQCGGEDAGAVPAGDFGGPVAGSPDNHCYVNPADGGSGPVLVTVVDPEHCHSNAGPPDSGQPAGPEFGPTNYGTEADDDDCKYQVGWWSTPIQYGREVTFYVSAVYTATGAPLTGANTYVEIESNSGQGSPPPDAGKAVTTENPPGVYRVGPFLMNQHGQWQVRFHFNETCDDAWPDSPHGHAAFFFTVP